MSYGETKVYFDGSHYIAIPHTKRPPKRKLSLAVEAVEVKREIVESKEKSTPNDNVDVPFSMDTTQLDIFTYIEKNPVKQRLSTRKEAFEDAYTASLELPKGKRRSFIISAMLPYFKCEDTAKEYVKKNIERKHKNLIARRIRLTRKANLQDFNYFCTFTYDGAKHTEEEFRKKLKNCLALFAKRKGWKYIGVWERSPEKKRLHFHGIFQIPEGTKPGLMCEKRDFSVNKHRMVTTYSNTYFEEKFGRNDFEPIDSRKDLGGSIAYITKYIEKTGERIMYSRGLPQYFISDIMDEDVVCFIGRETRKLLLYDDFSCWDEGCYMGQVSSDTIQQMRKAN